MSEKNPQIIIIWICVGTVFAADGSWGKGEGGLGRMKNCAPVAATFLLSSPPSLRLDFKRTTCPMLILDCLWQEQQLDSVAWGLKKFRTKLASSPCILTSEYTPHRMATSTFWCTFHQDGKISPVWWEWGCTPTPFALSTITHKVGVYAPAEKADTLPLFLLYPYMYSVILTTRVQEVRAEALYDQVFSKS